MKPILLSLLLATTFACSFKKKSKSSSKATKENYAHEDYMIKATFADESTYQIETLKLKAYPLVLL